VIPSYIRGHEPIRTVEQIVSGDKGGMINLRKLGCMKMF
jgi:hypothetical protein